MPERVVVGCACMLLVNMSACTCTVSLSDGIELVGVSVNLARFFPLFFLMEVFSEVFSCEYAGHML